MGIVARAHVAQAELENLDPHDWARLVAEHVYAYGLVLGLRRGRFQPDAIGTMGLLAITELEQALSRAEELNRLVT